MLCKTTEQSCLVMGVLGRRRPGQSTSFHPLSRKDLALLDVGASNVKDMTVAGGELGGGLEPALTSS